MSFLYKMVRIIFKIRREILRRWCEREVREMLKRCGKAQTGARETEFWDFGENLFWGERSGLKRGGGGDARERRGYLHTYTSCDWDLRFWREFIFSERSSKNLRGGRRCPVRPGAQMFGGNGSYRTWDCGWAYSRNSRGRNKEHGLWGSWRLLSGGS